MNGFNKIAPDKFEPAIFDFFSKQWLLLTAGDFRSGDFNSMTVSWGFLGTMWNKPCVTLVVRPQRKTFEFLQKYDTFTCCAFPEEYRKDLAYLGKVSGRDVPEKLSGTALTPVKFDSVDAPAFEQASLVIGARVQLVTPSGANDFRDKQLAGEFYPAGDYHYIVMGEIISLARSV